MKPNNFPLVRHRWDVCAVMGRSGGWTSDHGGGWSNNALNESLGVLISRNLRKGMGDNLPTLALTFDRRNILLIGEKNMIILFRLFL